MLTTGFIRRSTARLSGTAAGKCLFFLLFAAVVFPLAASRAQSQGVAEAARQEKERKTKESPTPATKPHHVYTDEDLKRARILTPEDQLRAEARRKVSPQVPPTPADGALDATNAPKSGNIGASAEAVSAANESLGEIARQYRAQKVEAELAHPRVPRATERALRVPVPKFSLGERTAALAAPVEPTGSPSSVAPLKPTIVVGPKFLESGSRPIAPRHRRDPFAPPTLSRAAPSGELAIPTQRPKRPDVFTSQPIVPNLRRVIPSQPKAVEAPSMRTPRPLPNTFAHSLETPAAPAMSGDSNSESPVARPIGSAGLAIKPVVRGTRSATLRLRSLPSSKTIGPRAADPTVRPRVSLAPGSRVSRASDGSLRITVAAGDTLWAIAHKHLGHGARWHEIVRADGGALNPLRLMPGTELVITG